MAAVDKNDDDAGADGGSGAGAADDSTMTMASMREQLAELATELLRLQRVDGDVGHGDENAPRKSGALAPEALRRWVDNSRDADEGGVSAKESDAEDGVDDELGLMRAEIVALREKHEEERRKLTMTVRELRRRNDELETLAVHSNSGGTMSNEGASGKFVPRMKSLAQRWASPNPARVGQVSAGKEGGQMSTSEEGEEEVAATVQPSDTKNDDESDNTVSNLREKLRQSEQRASVLEQRLLIVKESGDAVIASLNEELADIAEDRTRSENAMIKELSALDSRRRAEREEFERQVQSWIARDADRDLEVEEYKRRIESLLGTVRMMDADVTRCRTESASSWDREAEEEITKDLIEYVEMLRSSSVTQKRGGGSKRGGTLLANINDALDLEFNANPLCADRMIEYYRSRSELKDFTLKSELPRMDYEVLTVDEETGKDVKLITADEIRSFFTSLDESGRGDDEIETIIRAANQSLLADPLAMLTGEGGGKLVHSGSFHSTVIATECRFKLDLRREGERRIKVQCELSICVPSGLEVSDEAEEATASNDEKDDKIVSPTLEIGRAYLQIQFSPSDTSTPSGPLVKYHLTDIKSSIDNFSDSDDARAIKSAAVALARDRHSYIQGCQSTAGSNARSNVKSRFASFSSRVKNGIGNAIMYE